jgi:hypothetical protein
MVDEHFKDGHWADEAWLAGLLGTMLSQEQVIKEQTVLQCLESPLVTTEAFS